MADYLVHILDAADPPAPVSGQTISPTGIASAEAFGTPVAAGPITAAAIASAEAFGTPVLSANSTINPNAIASAEAFGTPVVTTPQSISPSSIVSAEAFGTPVAAGPLTAGSIASAEALGTPSVTSNVTINPSSIGSAEAFGTPSVGMSLAPASITSQEAFGAPVAAGPLIAGSIASAEAFGSPTAIVNVTLYPISIGSEEALGTPSVGRSIQPSSIASEEAFGTPQVNFAALAPTGIGSQEAFGTPVVAGPVLATGIPSAETFGAHTVVPGGLTIYPNAISSEEAFGTPSAAQLAVSAGIPSEEAFGVPTVSTLTQVQPTGIASAEAFGAPQVNLTILPNGIPSAEAFGTHLVGTNNVQAPGIPSEEAFGTPVISGPVVVPSINSLEAFGRPLIFLPADLTVQPAEADFLGGTTLQIFGGQLDMSNCLDDFADSIVDPAQWTDQSSGSGSVTERGVDRVLVLDTGTTPGSIARLDQDQAGAVYDLDIEARFRLATDTRPPTGIRHVFAELGLELLAPASGRLVVQIGLSELGLDISVETVVNGVSSIARTILQRVLRDESGRGVVLRVLRAGRRIHVFRNGVELETLEWFSDPCAPTVAVRNDPTTSTRVVSEVSQWLRRPIVRFGDDPIRDLVLRSRERAVGSAPAVDADDIGTFDVNVTGCAGPPSIIPGGFTFTQSDELVRFEDGQRSLVVSNDPTLTKRRGR